LRRSKQIDEEVVEAPLVDTLIYIWSQFSVGIEKSDMRSARIS